MDYQELYKALEEAGTEQNRKIYRRHGATGNLFGVSFAVLRDLKKKVNPAGKKKGENQEIANQLWNTKNMDAMTLATLIAEPQKMTPSNARAWADEVDYSVLADTLAELLSKTGFAIDLVEKWTTIDNEYIRRIGFTILNYLAKNDKSLDNNFFLPYIDYVCDNMQQSPNRAKEGMNNCLIMIGGKNEFLRNKVLEAAKIIGPVEIDHGETSCQTFVIETYLDRIWARKNKKR